MPASQTELHNVPPTDLAGEIALYVHWPFCLSKCPYCDFNSHVRATVDEKRFLAAYMREMDWLAGESGRSKLTSVFFGGGTPSLMPPEIAARIVERAGALWGSGGEVEITLEANPTSVEAGCFREFAGAGINRLSLGVQALDDRALAFLGRAHSVDEALAALEVAQDNFKRVNIDLIYARPDQTPESWRRELGRALTLGTEHVSLYQLTLEEGTPFLGRHRRGEFTLPDDECGNALYDVTGELTAAAGLPAYEISNHARPGKECRHNLDIWRGGLYASIGPGAHGRLQDSSGNIISYNHHRKPEAWLDAVEKNGHGTERREALLPTERAEEMVMMGLRLAGGIDKTEFAARAGKSLEDTLNAEPLQDLLEGGYLEDSDNGLRATAKGWRVLNSIITALLA